MSNKNLDSLRSPLDPTPSTVDRSSLRDTGVVVPQRREEYTMFTSKIHPSLQKKWQAIAKKEGLPLFIVLEQALQKAIASYEEKHGEIDIASDKKVHDSIF